LLVDTSAGVINLRTWAMFCSDGTEPVPISGAVLSESVDRHLDRSLGAMLDAVFLAIPSYR
jgi:hypothetical protein